MVRKSVFAAQREARATLTALGIERDGDFHILRSVQVEALLAEADRVRYRKPKHANGSRARYFHDMLQRRARDRLFWRGASGGKLSGAS